MSLRCEGNDERLQLHCCGHQETYKYEQRWRMLPWLLQNIRARLRQKAGIPIQPAADASVWTDMKAARCITVGGSACHRVAQWA